MVMSYYFGGVCLVFAVAALCVAGLHVRGVSDTALIAAGQCLLLLSVALARPHVSTTLFSAGGTAVLVVDVSISMKADDARPTRLARSQAQARDFVARYADRLRIGLVSFAGNVIAEAEPTTRREALFTAIDRLAARPGTAIGSGITTALGMIFPEAVKRNRLWWWCSWWWDRWRGGCGVAAVL